MKKLTIGILAHVDAGKTTLTEALLYRTGQIRRAGRVDHGDTFLDTDPMERSRGITIFSKQARLRTEALSAVLLDTPRHVDFSAETERAVQVIDTAVLLISGTDGVQGHTRTLMSLLARHGVPTAVFVNKMDLDGADRAAVLASLRGEFSGEFVDFSREGEETEEERNARMEEISLAGDELLEAFLESGTIGDGLIAEAVGRRALFPCWFGSALRMEGVDTLLSGLARYLPEPERPEAFGARVYKIGRDSQGTRITYLKVTGGALRVKELLTTKAGPEKADQIRLYSGEKYELTDCAEAGEICGVTGLAGTAPGDGLGTEQSGGLPVLQPVLAYSLILPRDVPAPAMYRNMKLLEEELPELRVLWEERTQEIRVMLMGSVQTEILTKMIADRFGAAVQFGPGSCVYKETLARPVEGVGHFEPLRHYAEVHLLLEPGDPGSGVTAASACPEDALETRWQRLILTHILEREHPGVLTGSALTDVKITLLSGKAHLKHTEGGDFRQAVYRAVRQGLRSGETLLLEPVYAFTLELPPGSLGRALGDLAAFGAQHEPPEYLVRGSAERVRIRGRAAVSAMSAYGAEVHAYTRGNGSLQLVPDGYQPCRNGAEVIAASGYDPDADPDNPCGSVFCSHGAGFFVPWDQVPDYMHLPFAWEEGEEEPEVGYDPSGEAAFHFSAEKRSGPSGEDAEFLAVYQREFGRKEEEKRAVRRRWNRPKSTSVPPSGPKTDKHGNLVYPKKDERERCLIVDGYNVIFAWEDLHALAETNIDSARDKLLEILSSFQGYRGEKVTVVFDAYRRKPNPGKKEQYDHLEVIYTKEGETADACIERLVHDLRQKYRITVVTSDALEQQTVLSLGALRMPSRELREEIERTNREGRMFF